MNNKKAELVRGFTLIELIIVLLIFTFLFGAILTVLVSQDRSWQTGYKKLTEQQEARRAMDEITRYLRQSSTKWEVNGAPPSFYPVTITANTQLDFFIPVFYGICCPGSCTQPSDCYPDCCPTCPDSTICLNPHNADEIRSLSKVTFRLANGQLLKKVGSEAEVVVASYIKSINFSCGCTGCGIIDSNCPVAKITIKTEKVKEFTLTSMVTLRNTDVILSDDVTVDLGES